MFWFCLNKTKGAALIKRPANLIVKTVAAYACSQEVLVILTRIQQTVNWLNLFFLFRRIAFTKYEERKEAAVKIAQESRKIENMFNKMARQNIQVLSDLCMPDIQDIVDILYAADLFDNECLFS